MSILLATLLPDPADVLGDSSDATFLSENFVYTVPPTTFGTTAFYQSGAILDGPGIGTIDYLIFFVRRRVRDFLDPSEYGFGTIRWFEAASPGSPGTATASAVPPLGSFGWANSGQIATKPTTGAWTWAAVNDLTAVGSNLDYGTDTGPVVVSSNFDIADVYIEVWGTLPGGGAGREVVAGRRRNFSALRPRRVLSLEALMPFFPPPAYSGLWSIPWANASPLRESFGYLTDVRASRTGVEQRARLRSVPLETLEYDFVAEGAEAALAQSLILGQQGGVSLIPYWQYASRLTAALPNSSLLIPIDDALLAPYRNGGFVVLWLDAFTTEVKTVASTSGSGVLLTGGTAGDWPAGTLVMPARRGRLKETQSVRWESSRVLTGRAIFSIEPVLEA